VPKKAEPTLPGEFYDAEWPSFNQKKMVLVPPKEIPAETNTGIAVNQFNMFRRRLPSIGGTGSGIAHYSGDIQGPDLEQQYRQKFGKYADQIDFQNINNVSYMQMMTMQILQQMSADRGPGQAGGAVSSRRKEVTFEDEEPSSGGGGGGGAAIIIVGLIVALFIFQ
jgi:hypothetical protein